MGGYANPVIFRRKLSVLSGAEQKGPGDKPPGDGCSACRAAGLQRHHGPRAGGRRTDGAAP